MCIPGSRHSPIRVASGAPLSLLPRPRSQHATRERGCVSSSSPLHPGSARHEPRAVQTLTSTNRLSSVPHTSHSQHWSDFVNGRAVTSTMSHFLALFMVPIFEGLARTVAPFLYVSSFLVWLCWFFNDGRNYGGSAWYVIKKKQAGWKKRKTPSMAIASEPGTASSTIVSNSSGSNNKPKGAQGHVLRASDTPLIWKMLWWEILTINKKWEHCDVVQICGYSSGQKVGSNNWQRFVKVGVRNNKKKTKVRLTRGLAQNEEQPLGVSFGCFIKQPPQTHSRPRETQKCILVGRKLDSRKWPNTNRRFGTVYLGPSNQSIPSTKRTSHGRPFEQMHRLNSWINFEVSQPRLEISVIQYFFQSRLILPRTDEATTSGY